MFGHSAPACLAHQRVRLAPALQALRDVLCVGTHLVPLVVLGQQSAAAAASSSCYDGNGNGTSAGAAAAFGGTASYLGDACNKGENATAAVDRTLPQRPARR